MARGERVYAVLNLYPYNSGHLMVGALPARRRLHRADRWRSAPSWPRSPSGRCAAMRAVSGAQGFNIGMNQGVRRRRRHRRPPAPARGAAVGRRHQLHAGGRPHQGAAAAARRHPPPARHRLDLTRYVTTRTAEPASGRSTGKRSALRGRGLLRLARLVLRHRVVADERAGEGAARRSATAARPRSAPARSPAPRPGPACARRRSGSVPSTRPRRPDRSLITAPT